MIGNGQPLVYVVVLTWNDVPGALACLAALARLTYPNYHVLVVDNGSTDGTPQAVQECYPGVQLLRQDRNLGYAGGNNAGLRLALAAGAAYVLLLNDDTLATPESLSILVAAAEADPSLGMLGPALVSARDPARIYLGGRINWADGDGLEVPAAPGDLAVSQAEVEYVPGSALLARAAAIRQIGLLDASYFAYYEDADWSQRCRQAGYRCAVVPAARVVHYNTVDAHLTRPMRSLYYPRRNQVHFMRRYAPSTSRHWLRRYLAARMREYLTIARQGEAASARSLVAGVWAGLRGVQGVGIERVPGAIVAIFALAARLQEWRVTILTKAATSRPKASPPVRRLLRRLVRPVERRLARPLPATLPPAPPVTIAAYVRASTGMGEAARGTIAALQDVGHPVSYVDLDPTPTLAEAELPANAPPARGRRANLLHVNAVNVLPTYRLLKRGFFAGQINVAYWFWEMATFPIRWQGAFDLFDEVWVASRYTQATLATTSPIPVVQVPPLVRPAPPAPLSRTALGLPEDRFIFLFSFDALSILERKNPWGVIQAFCAAFGATHSAARHAPLLVIKMNNSDLVAGRDESLGLPPDYANSLAQAVRGVGGVFLDVRFDRATTSALMAACDCYVSLHRCEGFGLTMAEAMYFGKPCIATGYSGNLDFMTPSNSYPVGYRLVELARDWGPYEAGDHWAEPDLAHAAALMDEVYTRPAEAAARGSLAARDIRRCYGGEAVGRAMTRRLQLLAWRKGRRLVGVSL